MAAKLAVAFDPVLRQVDHRRLCVVPHWRQMVPFRVATAEIIPVPSDVEDVVQVLFTHHAERVQPLVLERLSGKRCPTP